MHVLKCLSRFKVRADVKENLSSLKIVVSRKFVFSSDFAFFFLPPFY